MPTSTVTDAEILAAVEGPPSFSAPPTAPLRSAIVRQAAGEPVDDLLDLYRRVLANVLIDRDGRTPTQATEIAAACERAIRAEGETR